jgi:hypothetical protein
MKLRLTILVLIILSAFAACQSGPPPTEVLLEVTRLVTVVVTADTGQQGPLPLESTPSPEHTADVQAEVAASPTPDVTATATQSPIPSPIIGQVYVAEQTFENGSLFWLRPIDQIWILTTSAEETGIWQIVADNFEEGMPESDPALVPPDGMFQPIRGFGMLWRETPNLRDTLGWATSEEVGYLANYQYHYGGTVDANGNFIQGPGYHLLESVSRTVYRFNEGIWTWEFVEQTK